MQHPPVPAPRIFEPRILMLLASVCAALATVAGCTRQVNERLVGVWVGTPDTASAYAARNQEAFGVDNSDPNAAVPGSDLENRAVRITLDMRPGGEITMFRDDGKDELRGTWKVLDVVGRRARLQIAVKNRETGEHRHELNAIEEDDREIRNFSIEFSPTDDGFTLAEEGADPRFGALLFRKVEG